MLLALWFAYGENWDGAQVADNFMLIRRRRR